MLVRRHHPRRQVRLEIRERVEGQICETVVFDRSWTIQPPDFRLTFRIPNVFGMWAVANF